VIQHVREKFSCRACEAISQPPAPSQPIARGRTGPKLLAHILFSKYGLHLPLNRQSAVYAREGIDLDVSTLADWVGAAAATLMPLVDAIRGHVFAAERIHADDTTVPVLAKGKTRTGRFWTYVRDDRPFCRPRSAGGSVLRVADAIRTGMSIREAAKELGMHRSKVERLKAKAKEQGLLDV
jgi:transposase